MNTTKAVPQSVSGVQLLNENLLDVTRRINRVADRIGTLANQFGAPSTGNPVGPAVVEPTTTNDHMAQINSALCILEAITSRIDNQ